MLFCCPELEINFDLGGCPFSRVEEGSGTLGTPLRLQYRRNQNPFTVTLTPTTIDGVESFGLGSFINSLTIGLTFRASAGTM